MCVHMHGLFIHFPLIKVGSSVVVVVVVRKHGIALEHVRSVEYTLKRCRWI